MFRNIRKFVAIEVLSLVVGAGTALAAPGDMDPSFGTGGRLESTDPVPMPDGRLALPWISAAGLEIQMLDADGALDSSWGTNGITRMPLVAEREWFDPTNVAVGTDGSLILHGIVPRTIDAQTKTVPAVLRIDASGRPDAGFGPDGNGIVPVHPLPDSLSRGGVSAVAVQADGSILVAAAEAGFDYCGRSVAVLRLSPTGAPDTGFGINGWAEIADGASDSCVLSFVGVRANGSILVTNGSRFWALRSDGPPDPGFGTAGELPDALPGHTGTVLLPDGGLLLVAQAGNPAGRTRLVRLNAAGQPDTTFGTGGTVDLHLGALALGSSGAVDSPSSLRLSTDGQSVLLAFGSYLQSTAGDRYCGGVARLGFDGRLDAGFGRGGLSCIMGWGWPRLAVQATGQPLLMHDSGNTIRLLLDARPSPGVVSMTSDTFVREQDGTATVTVSRSAGRDGAISVDYTTVAGTAAAGDFRSTSGRLEWADGEDGDRTITIVINDDTESEGTSRPSTMEEHFGLELARAGGEALLWNATGRVVILDNDPMAATPAPATSSSGGGGATSWAALLALIALAVTRVRTLRPVVVVEALRPLRDPGDLQVLRVAQQQQMAEQVQRGEAENDEERRHTGIRPRRAVRAAAPGLPVRSSRRGSRRA